MAKKLSNKIIDFASAGAAVFGSGRLALAAAGAVATSIVVANAFASSMEGVHSPSQEASAALASDIQKRLDDAMPGLGVIVVDLHENSLPVSDQIAARENADCVVYSALYPTSQIWEMSAIGDVTEDALSRAAVYTNVGLCLGAASPEQAKAFGVIMATLDTGSNDLPKLMAIRTELEELRGNLMAYEHWSSTAWNVADAFTEGRIETFPHDPSILDMFDKAYDLWDETANVDLASRFGDSFRKSLMKNAEYLQVKGGIMAVMPVESARMISDDVEPINRFWTLYDILHSEMPREFDSVQRADINFTAALKSLEDLGMLGSSAGRTMARAMGSDIDFDYELVTRAQDALNPHNIQGVLYEVDVAGEFLVYDANGKGFAISDEQRRPVAIGVGTAIPIFAKREGTVMDLAGLDNNADLSWMRL